MLDVQTDVAIQEIMTTNVIAVNPNDLMIKVQSIFESHQFHHLPVVDAKGKLYGCLSHQDYNKVLNTLSVFEKSKRAKEMNNQFLNVLLVSDVMIKDVVTLQPTSTIKEAFNIFQQNLFHAAPVVDEDHRVVGMLSVYDLLNYAFGD